MENGQLLLEAMDMILKYTSSKDIRFVLAAARLFVVHFLPLVGEGQKFR